MATSPHNPNCGGRCKCVGVRGRDVGKGMPRGSVGKRVRVSGPNILPPRLPHISSLIFPYISPYLPHTPTHFPTPPLIPLFHISPSSPHTPTHFPTPIPTSPSTSQSVVKLPCDEVSVTKLLWRSYHVAKLLATETRVVLLIT